VTIEKGRTWGETGGLPAGGVIVRSDAEARAVVERARRAGDAVPPLGLLGGDLCRTLGGTGHEGRLRDGTGVRLPVDLGAALIDGRLHWFLAHLVARRGWWTGKIVAVMNAQFLGPWDVAPRSHPNDGRLDVLDVTMGPGERWKARGRLKAGTHVPHPGIAERRVTAIQVDLPGRCPVRLDGEVASPAATNLTVRVEPDALLCVI